MKNLTNEVILDVLNTSKSTVIAIEYITDETKSRTEKGVKLVQKHVKINNLYLNHEYAQKVQRLTDNADFQANEMKGKTRISSTFIVSDKTNEILLDGKILNSESVELINYMHKGQIISKENANGLNLFAPAFFAPKSTYTSGRGSVSVEDDFKMITLGISKITYLKAFGIEYKR